MSRYFPKPNTLYRDVKLDVNISNYAIKSDGK